MERRNFMRNGLGALMAGSIVGDKNNFSTTEINNMQSQTSDSPKGVFFQNPSYEFRFLNVLGKAHYKFADIGELLAIRDLTDEASPISFVNAYIKFADSCKAIADNAKSKGHLVSARDAYFRASNYYYSAMDFLDDAMQGDRMTELFKVHRECWKSGAELMDFKYEEFEIPYEGKSLAGFFISRKNDKTRRPLLIFNNGSDGSILDAWTYGGAGAFERGYNVMTFDGPGQGSSLFEKKIYFRYDWEKAITPVIDSVINRKDVDKNKIAILGVSQAGYWVPRAAAFEKRMKVIIADPGVTDVSSSWLKSVPESLLSLLKSGDKKAFNEYLAVGAQKDPKSAIVFNFRARPFGITDAFDLFTEVQKYNLKDVAGKIECQVIVTSPEDESFWPGQSQQLYDLIRSPKTMLTFTEAQGANYHCEPKARVFWEQQVYDLLDEIMRK